eukprot:1793853-Prymnesium_polylepis.1
MRTATRPPRTPGCGTPKEAARPAAHCSAAACTETCTAIAPGPTARAEVSGSISLAASSPHGTCGRAPGGTAASAQNARAECQTNPRGFGWGRTRAVRAGLQATATRAHPLGTALRRQRQPCDARVERLDGPRGGLVGIVVGFNRHGVLFELEGAAHRPRATRRQAHRLGDHPLLARGDHRQLAAPRGALELRGGALVGGDHPVHRQGAHRHDAHVCDLHLDRPRVHVGRGRAGVGRPSVHGDRCTARRLGREVRFRRDALVAAQLGAVPGKSGSAAAHGLRLEVGNRRP